MKMRTTICIDHDEENSFNVQKLIEQFKEQLIEAMDVGLDMEPDSFFNFDYVCDKVKEEGA